MNSDKKFSKALMKMAEITYRSDLAFQEKLQHILNEVISCIDAGKGSIMITREVEFLEVVASTDPKLIGIRQRLSEKSPATWVFLHLTPLYMENGVHNGPPLRNKFQTYAKDAFLVAPILCADKAIGVLSVTEKKGADLFSTDEQEIIITFAGQIISAIEHHRLNQSLTENQRCLEEKNQKLEMLEKLRTDLFNMLIHDLKGPISEILANIDILTYTVDQENMEYVKAAQAGCNTLFGMISDLLDIARLEEGSLELVQEMITPAEMLTEAISRVDSFARTRSVPLLEKRPEGMEGAAFYGDRGLLVRVLQNLLMNAIQHSPEEKAVEIGYEMEENGRIRFFVKDQGPGIAPALQTAIFDKFFQIRKKNDGRMYSTGLGLAFCKMAVTAHNGAIGVQSDGKNGSIFGFAIPTGE
ncbi:MAG: ATP-binding protein [Pseudomonadota bacterium]